MEEWLVLDCISKCVTWLIAGFGTMKVFTNMEIKLNFSFKANKDDRGK
jgi:hypothetical protein